MIRFLKNIFGTRNDRYLKSKSKLVDKINALELDYQKLSNQAILAKTQEFRERFNQGESLNQLLPEAFATVREASVRTLGLRHFDVQLIGGIALHEGKISEMKTGEGKTLVATLAAYLNAIPGKGVHVVTVNPYLAERDAKWMGQVYAFLGMRTGIIIPGLTREERQNAYQADITYGTNNELGFDYLRDNMVSRIEERVSQERAFAIIDEIDSILISEARTPLIISGPIEESPNIYLRMIELTKQLEKNIDFAVIEKENQIHLNDEGHEHLEQLLKKDRLLNDSSNLYSPENAKLLHYSQSCLKALHLYHKNVQYMIANGQAIIIDEHTGRAMPGRRWSDGIHQAIEAKEGLNIQPENQTLASITFQNYFRMYTKLSGMTGTADTEASEFLEIYNLEVIAIPTNRPSQRKDDSDKVYLDQKSKYNAIIEDIKQRRATGQPILVGTCSVESSEQLSVLLTEQNIPHEVLNAKNHAREAEIIAQAGQKGALTISTNMAGRGTDIILGGANKSQDNWQSLHKEVVGLGGLHVIGAERNESRRIDNQLIGRSGRQGDPGSSQFYLAMDDSLLRIFASEKMQQIMQMFGVKEGEVLQAPMLTRAIENAQKKVEGYHFDIRKELLKYDDIANEQRTLIYGLRNEVIQSEEISDLISDMAENLARQLQEQHAPHETDTTHWDLNQLQNIMTSEYQTDIDFSHSTLDANMVFKSILQALKNTVQTNTQGINPGDMQSIEKHLTLNTIDHFWKEHLMNMDMLRQGIHFRSYAQKNPAHEYKREALELFKKLLNEIRVHIWRVLTHLKVEQQAPSTNSYQMTFEDSGQ
ncbi:MAG: preprotein translocase subunit SecA [Gammaproteobacteria bacterium]|nr:preprotein translocase subunit SecA [Gammaproteobacteria bacterium]